MKILRSCVITFWFWSEIDTTGYLYSWSFYQQNAQWKLARRPEVPFKLIKTIHTCHANVYSEYSAQANKQMECVRTTE